VDFNCRGSPKAAGEEDCSTILQAGCWVSNEAADHYQ